jgi:tungstate transport system substrate-binding protein
MLYASSGHRAGSADRAVAPETRGLKLMTMGRARRAARAIVVALAVSLVAAAAAEAQQQRPLVVQSTTSVRDSGLLDQLITPQFKRRFPQYDLRFVAVGTGQAITNARAGQGDVLIGHSPPLEEQFLRDGFSDERIGRTVMWNDFVIVGPASDPAGVLRAARNNAVGAFEAIAAAGTAGRAHFVSRGDNSGTNTKEREIWGLSRVAHAANNEPSGRWYHKAGLGMADTLRLTQQCPFGGGCYTITDRGTLQQLTSNRAITALRTVMDEQSARARGGQQLMLNVYNVYAISPRKYPAVNIQGARAFMDFMTSQSFQDALARFPSRRRPGFFPAAFPRVELSRTPRRTIAARTFVTVPGTLTSAVPGADPLSGLPLRLARLPTPVNPVVLDRDRTGRHGTFRLRTRLNRSATLFLRTPRFRNLGPMTHSLGRFTVRASVSMADARASARRVALSGRVYPAAGRRRAVLQVRARRPGGSFAVVRRVRLPRTGSRYRVGVNLPGGRWQLSTRYVDPGVVSSGVSRVRSVSVP